MYSMPMRRQYDSRSTPRISRRLAIGLPPKPPVANSRSRSHSVRPWVTTSRSGWRALAELQRVGVGHQVAAHAVGVDQLLDAGLLGDVVLVRGRDVADPADRLVGDAQRAEDLVVEVVLAEQQAVDPAQEVAGLRTLDDAVVVGRRQRHDLADGQPGQRLGGRALVLRGVLHRADADDRALAGHQPRHRVDGADRARVGQADRGADEVVGGQLVAAGPPDDVLVRRPEAGEVHRLGALDRRARAGCGVPSGFWMSIARPKFTCSGLTTAGLPSTSVKPWFISGIVGERLDDGDSRSGG